MILALRCGCVSHAAWPDDGVASSGMLRQQDLRGVISLGSWMTASDAGGGGGDGAWLLATTKELIEHTCRIFSLARRRVGSLILLRESFLTINKHGEFHVRQRTANVCEHPIECWIHSDSLANKILREWMNEWMNERTLAAVFSFLREERLSCDVILLRGENYDANIVKVASNRRTSNYWIF